MGLDRNLRRLLVADMRVERRHQHQRIVEMLLDALLVRLNAACAIVVERHAPVGQELRRFKHVMQNDRLEYVQLEMPLRASHANRKVIAEHMHGDHRQGFGLGRVDLARHDRGARLVFRDPQFPDASARAAGIKADVIGYFHARAGQGAERSADVDHCVVRRQGGEFVGRRNERLARLLRENASDRLAETRVRVQSGADSPFRQSPAASALGTPARSRDRLVELGRPARNHLAQSQRRCVLQMRAADHHDMGESLRLGVQRVAQLSDGRQKPRPDLAHRGDMHDRREHVIRRLTVIDVVVRMDRLLRPDHAARNLNGPVGDHFVGVHVGLGAGPGLEHDQRKLVVELAFDHVLSRTDDEIDLVLWQMLKLEIGQRRAFLQ